MTDQVNAVVERLEGLLHTDLEFTADEGGIIAEVVTLIRQLTADLDAAKEREKKLAGTLQAIKDSASWQIEFYNKNGPTWTGKDGHEYDDMSASLTRAEEIIQQVNAALERP